MSLGSGTQACWVGRARYGPPRPTGGHCPTSPGEAPRNGGGLMAAARRAVDTVALIIVVAIVAMILDPHRRTAELIGQVGTAFIDLLRQPPIDLLPPCGEERAVRLAEWLAS
jgi:hypothetical protein